LSIRIFHVPLEVMTPDPAGEPGIDPRDTVASHERVGSDHAHGMSPKPGSRSAALSPDVETNAWEVNAA